MRSTAASWVESSCRRCRENYMDYVKMLEAFKTLNESNQRWIWAAMVMFCLDNREKFTKSVGTIVVEMVDGLNE